MYRMEKKGTVLALEVLHLWPVHHTVRQVEATHVHNVYKHTQNPASKFAFHFIVVIILRTFVVVPPPSISSPSIFYDNLRNMAQYGIGA